MGLIGRTTEAQRNTALAAELGTSYPALFRQIRGFFRVRGLRPEEASDLAQEAIVRTLVHLRRRGRTEEDLRPLVATIATNLYRDRGRRRHPRFVALGEAEELPDDSTEPQDLALAAERREALREAVASLAPRHRRVIALYVHGLGPAEIARELGIKRNAADALLHRARRRLASKLEPGGISLGVLGVFGLRLRGGARRVAEWLSQLDPSGSLANATSSLAAVGLVAVITIGAPPTQAVRSPAVDSATVHVASIAGDGAAQARQQAVADDGSSARSTPGASSARPPDPAIGVTADTGPGEGDEVGAWIQEDDREDLGIVGPVVTALRQRHAGRLVEDLDAQLVAGVCRRRGSQQDAEQDAHGGKQSSNSCFHLTSF